jgi:beta-glucanase (GH16 family)
MRERSARCAAVVVVLACVGLGVSSPPEPRVAEPSAAPATTNAERLNGKLHPPPVNWRPRFVENFDGTTIDPRRWGRCHWWARGGCTIASNDELEWYRPENVVVGGGVLRLEAREGEYTNTEGETFPYTSGMVSTGPVRYERGARFSFTYGYVEARLRLPKGQGLWPAFWLLPADSESRPEVDIVETLGDTPNRARFHLHYRGSGGARRSLGQDHVSATLADGRWHRFAVDWQPGSLTWIVDGRERWRVRGPAVPAEPLYLVLNLAVGGTWPGPPGEATEFPAAVQADWIRVWRP